MQCFLGNPDSRLLHLEAYQLILAIAKKALDENLFQNAQKTMDREPPSFKQGDRVYYKENNQEMDLKWRPRYRIVCIECDGHYLHIENQTMGKTRSCNIKDVVLILPIEFWDIDMQFSRARKYINHPANVPTIMLNN